MKTMFSFHHAALGLLYFMLCLCCLTTNTVSNAQELINVDDWAVPSADQESLPPRTAKVGDTAQFNWLFGSVHDVYIHPNMNCDWDGRILVGEVTGANYTFTEDDVGELFFACDKFQHCDFGMHITFTVTSDNDSNQDDNNNIMNDPESASSTQFNGMFISVVTTILSLVTLPLLQIL